MKLIYKTIRYLTIIDYYLEKAIKKFIIKPRYILTGQCNKCGLCCYRKIGIMAHPRIIKSKFLSKIVTKFYYHVNDFILSEIDTEDNVFIFECLHFDKQNMKCTSYKNRPAACRDYPLIRYFDAPSTFEECGFKTKLRK